MAGTDFAAATRIGLEFGLLTRGLAYLYEFLKPVTIWLPHPSRFSMGGRHGPERLHVSKLWSFLWA